jgi:glucan phosphorylase
MGAVRPCINSYHRPYLSMEFLIGRSLTNNIINMGVEDYVRGDLQSDGQGIGPGARQRHLPRSRALGAQGGAQPGGFGSRFSSDRTIQQYASEIWGAAPCPVPG